MSLFKEFNVTEGSKFQFRFEAFNVPNLTDFSGPSTNIDALHLRTDHQHL